MYTVSNLDRLNTIADNIIMREIEISSYDLNISNYNALLSTLPQGDWLPEIEQYKGVTDLDLVPDEYDDMVNEYNFRDRIRSVLKTEKRERMKSYQLYLALLAQLPEESKEQLIADAVTRRNQQLASSG